MSKQGLDICFLNVGSLRSKSYDKTNDIFMKSISAQDIVLLAETHLGYRDNVQIDRFHYFPICRPMSRNNQHFGGLAILSKIDINKTKSTNLYPPTKGCFRETFKSQNINPIFRS